MIDGTVCRAESKDYYVRLEDGNIVRSSLRGRIKKQFNLKKDKLYARDIVTVGDRVSISIENDGHGVIEKIQPRKNYLSRKAPKLKGASFRGERLEQVIAANLDQIFIVASIFEPTLKVTLIDRILVAAESGKLKANIIINKIDLDEEDDFLYYQDLYEEVGYTVFPASAETGEGIEEIKDAMSGKVNIFWGQSGVGKSSLFNEIFPGLNFNTGDVSYFTEKGRHTTVTSVLEQIDENTAVIDTPGIREIDPYGLKKEDLGHYFPEFEEFIYNCKFNTCTHHHEPGCAVLDAVDNEEIRIERYRSYLGMLDSVESDKNY